MLIPRVVGDEGSEVVIVVDVEDRNVVVQGVREDVVVYSVVYIIAPDREVLG